MADVLEKKEQPSVLEKANEIMDEAIEKAGELICTRPQVAEIILKQLLRCDPEHLSGLQLLGLCKHRMGDNAEAIEIIQTALELDPDNADNWNNLGLAYAGLTQHDRAIESITKALSINPRQFLFKNNLALQYRAVGDYEKAISIMKESISIYEKPQLWLNLGGIYGEMRDIVNSKRCFDKALELDPEYPAAHVDLAFVHHLSGNWKKGFEEYEWRFWYYPQMKHYLNHFDQTKLWNGKDSINGKTVFIYAEQGAGDAIMFVRYAKYLKENGAKVIIHTASPLESLLKRVEGVDGVNTRDIFLDKGEDFPEYDYQFSLMSAPHLLGMPEISGKPYITPKTDSFKDYMKDKYSSTFNIGIVWAGNPAHPHDKKRSIPLKHFESIMNIEKVKLFSMQMDIRKRQYGATYRNMSSEDCGTNDTYSNRFQAENNVVDYCEGCDHMKITDLTQMMQSFEDTATILAGLDLVICCDTATAHLAGAMGVPVWILIPYNPDWRWKLTGETTPWYDSMRIFRQRDRDNWKELFERVTTELREIIL